MLNRLQPRTLAQQMILLMTVSLSLLFIAFFVADAIQQKTLEETATGTEQLSRIKSLLPLVKVLNEPQLREFERSFSRCFYGYRISQQPLDFSGERQEMLEVRIGNYLDLERSKVRVHTATFSQADFSYEQCDGSMSFPLDGMVISIRLGEKKWLNSEVHRHVWHLRESHSWLFWAITAFTVIAALSIILISHLTRPLSALSHASRQFAKGLVVSEVKKQGPPDLQDTIESFNTMQKDVIGAIENRTVTLAAISHDAFGRP